MRPFHFIIAPVLTSILFLSIHSGAEKSSETKKNDDRKETNFRFQSESQFRPRKRVHGEIASKTL
jgi:hypothetical protein